MNNELSKTIGMRINTLLGEQDKKQKDLAAYLGVTDNTISYFVSGKRKPNTEQLLEIARFFETTTDYLLDLSTVSTNDKDLQFICDYTGLSEKSINQIVNNSDYKDVVNWFISSVKFDLLIQEIYFYCDYNRIYDFFKSPKADSNGFIPTFESTAKNRSVMRDKKDLNLFRIQEISKDIAKRIYKEHKEDF